ncbi:MAG: apolipoprotein N-acyltransferase [Rhodoferax sp.]
MLRGRNRARRAVGSGAVLALAGVAQAFSMAWPWDSVAPLWERGEPVWWLQLAALALALAVLEGSTSARQAALRGAGFATVWLAASWGWLFISMHTYGGLPAPLSALAVLALGAGLGLYYALALGVFFALARVHIALKAPLFVACWTMAELARARWFTGFGWSAIGYSHVQGPLAPLLPWVGVYGVGAVAAGLAALLALAGPWPQRIARCCVVALALLALPWLPRPHGHSAGSLSVALLQGNIAQEEKFLPHRGVADALLWYGHQLRQRQAQLVVTPETALPLLPQQLPQGYWDGLHAVFAHGERAALVGIPLGDADQGYTNSVLGLVPGQAQDWRYDKHHLVPFGEFIPPLFRWFTELMAIPLGDFNRGAQVQPPLNWQGQRIGVGICYENLFGTTLAAALRDPANGPTLWVNVSNLGWFGAHLAMDQHLVISRARALELDRPLVLATNTGHTAVVDHLGRVVAALPPHQRGVLEATVEGRSGLTPYAAWASVWGHGPLWWLALGVLALAWRRARVPESLKSAP